MIYNRLIESDLKGAFNMRRTIYEINYERVEPLLAEYNKIEVKGYMPLVIEKIGENEYSLAHYYEQDGDLVQDPEMTIKIHPELKMVEALTYYQPALGIYQEVYPEPGKFYPILKKELNEFLGMWLRNLKQQGFCKAARV